MRGEKKRYCYIQKLITNKKYLIQEEKNMNIKEMNEEIIEKTAGNEMERNIPQRDEPAGSILLFSETDSERYG